LRAIKIGAAGAALVVLLAVGAVWGLDLGPGPAAASETGGTPETGEAAGRTIDVTGEGAVSAEPDVAYVTVGVRTEAKTARDAQARNAEKAAAVLEAVKALGIADKDLQSCRVGLQPVTSYEERDRVPRVVGFRAVSTVRVIVRDMDGIGRVVDAAVEAGANEVRTPT